MSRVALFIHGTGVRQPSYSDSFARASTLCQTLQPGLLTFEECYWGECCGARLAAGGASIPDFDATRSALEEANSEDQELTLWELLYRDPLIECRLLLATLPPPSPFATGDGHLLAEAVNRGLIADGELSRVLCAPQHALSVMEIDRTRRALECAIRWLAGQSAFQTLIAAFGSLDSTQPTDGYAPILARAIIARAFVESSLLETPEDAGHALPFSSDAKLRDDLVQALSIDLGGAHRGFAGAFLQTVTAPLTGLALQSASWLARARRGAWMSDVALVAGDVLVYQGRGAAIRDFIRLRIHATGAEVLIAHSLGGIACVDLLIEQPEPTVKLLVTAGSQSPFFFEIGALQSLTLDPAKAPDARLPEAFPRWLNLFDTRDFLSFVGQGVFGARITDHRLNNRQPFPQSHSGYWTNRLTWDLVAQQLAAL